jgi:hypothetical protein
MDYDKSDIHTMLRKIEIEMEQICLWISHEYSEFKPTYKNGSVDQRKVALQNMLNKYAHLSIQHNEYIVALEKRMMNRNNA